MTAGARGGGGYLHHALFYDSPQALVGAAGPFLRAGLAAALARVGILMTGAPGKLNGRKGRCQRRDAQLHGILLPTARCWI